MSDSMGVSSAMKRILLVVLCVVIAIAIAGPKLLQMERQRQYRTLCLAPFTYEQVDSPRCDHETRERLPKP